MKNTGTKYKIKFGKTTGSKNKRKCSKCKGKGIVYVKRKSGTTDISYYDVCKCVKQKRPN